MLLETDSLTQKNDRGSEREGRGEGCGCGHLKGANFSVYVQFRDQLLPSGLSSRTLPHVLAQSPK